MSPEELNEHIESEYRRATQMAPGHTSPDKLVTRMADYAVKAVHLSERAGAAALAAVLAEGIEGAGITDELEEIWEAATNTYDHVIRELRENTDE